MSQDIGSKAYWGVAPRRRRISLALLLPLLLVVGGCTGTSPRASYATTPGLPAMFSVALSPAPRACPFMPGLGETPVTGGDAEVTRLMNGHLPTWLPSGFGLSGAWTEASATKTLFAETLWSDQRCRSVRVTFSSGGPGPGPWTVGYDNPRACGNAIMGMGECIGYSVSVTGGEVNVQTISLTRSDADRLVHSIKI